MTSMILIANTIIFIFLAVTWSKSTVVATIIKLVLIIMSILNFLYLTDMLRHIIRY